MKMMMNKISPKSLCLILAHTLYWSCLIHIGESTSTYSEHACTNSTASASTLSQDATYLANLNLLLSYLNSNATNDAGFYQTTVATGTQDASTGLFQCRGDITASLCRECVLNASREVLKRCPQEKQAVIWYDVCWIRYQDSSIFLPNPGIVPSTSLQSSETVREAERFNKLLAGVMDALANKAANSGSVKKFATAENNFTSSETLYSLAQCTPDLSAADCNTCLRSAIGFFPQCCSSKRGGAVFLPSCIVRFEFYPFFNSTTTPSISTDQVPLSAGKGKKSIITIIAIVGPISVVLVVFLIGFCFLRNKAKKIKKYLSLQRQDSVRNEISKGETFQFAMVEIKTATNNFSDENKIGRGGFGEVYMAWELWKEGTFLELLDPTLRNSFSRNEVVRCIHMGLLCVQENPVHRPTMATIVLMLNSYSAILPPPQQPALYNHNRTQSSTTTTGEHQFHQSMPNSSQWSANDGSMITEVYPR
ncbi:hypothetical protein F8388_008046 [Cannabis sativa]|uniref:Gnk2-homologous domain-containing protein n=1 Tax=Cannabis sativa TaxID=3483 RepID=A0A7J6DXP0_CANSA|nr:hypothetical protein F8388_008046 [Cannabis sativa]